MAKGNADCHIPNDRYREGWERIFGAKTDKNDKQQIVLGQTGVGCHPTHGKPELSKRLN